MDTPQFDKKSQRWRSVAAGLLLAALLAAPIIVVATMANPPSKDSFSVGAIADPNGPQLTYPALNHSCDVGSFAHGYLEFDVDPTQPGGMPGFDSWPPGSRCR